MKLNELKDVVRECLLEMLTPDVHGGISDTLYDLFSSGKDYISNDDITNLAEENNLYDNDHGRLSEYILEVLTPKYASENGYVVENGGYRKSITNLEETLKRKLTDLIIECIEEVKIEDKKSIEENMKDLSKYVKSISKSYSLRKNKMKNYEMCGCLPHHFDIRPMSQDKYDVVYFKDNSDRTKKFNLSYKELKEFVKNKLENDKDGNYVETAFNKCVENSKDKSVKKEKNESPNNDTENMLAEPHWVEEETEKQIDHSIKGEKVKYKYPKQTKDEKKHIEKGGKGKELNLPKKKIKSK